MTSPDLNHLAALLTVARERSFTKAAARLGMSQSSLSRTVTVKVSGQLVFNNAYQMLDAALQGFGLTYLPKALVEAHVQAGRLEWVLKDWFPTFTGTHAYYATRRRSSLAVRLVMAALRDNDY
jgi:DNA-binding transcriptional LysR family regulator